MKYQLIQRAFQLADRTNAVTSTWTANHREESLDPIGIGSKAKHRTTESADCNELSFFQSEWKCPDGNNSTHAPWHLGRGTYFAITERITDCIHFQRANTDYSNQSEIPIDTEALALVMLHRLTSVVWRLVFLHSKVVVHREFLRALYSHTFGRLVVYMNCQVHSKLPALFHKDIPFLDFF